MFFYETLTSLMKQRGVTAKQLSDLLGIGKNQFTYWKKNGNIPSGDILILLSDYFNCSIDFLLGRSEQPKLPSFSVLSTTEEDRYAAKFQKLAVGFDSLNDHAQDAVLDYLNYMVSQPKNLKNNNDSTQMNA